MNIINKPVDYLIRKLPVLGFNCSVTKYRSTIGYDNDLIDPDNDVSPSMLYNSMGYFMGYRQPIYSGKQSYTSESMFDNVYTDYIYFVLNAFENHSNCEILSLKTSINLSGSVAYSSIISIYCNILSYFLIPSPSPPRK